jgi:hypothetical protein
VVQFLARVQLQLARNLVVSRALDRLAVDGVGDDRLVLARQVLIQKLDHFFTADFVSVAHFF